MPDGVRLQRALLVMERERVYARIVKLAAAGDPTCLYLVRELSGPEQLLGGSGT